MEAALRASRREEAAPADPAPASDRDQKPLSRVLIATIYRESAGTGVQTHTWALARGMRKKGIDCEIVTAFDAGLFWLAVFAVRPLLLRWLNREWSTRWHHWSHQAALRGVVRRAARRQPPDVVLAPCLTSARAALEARAALGLRFPIGAICHFNESETAELWNQGELTSENTYRKRLRAEDEVLTSVDHVIYPSHWAGRIVDEVRGLKVEAASVIWNSAGEVADVPPLSRDRLGLAEDDLVLVNVGTLEARKNQLGLLSTFAAVRASFPAAKLLLVGDGPQRADITRRISELGLDSSVILLGRRGDVPAVLALSDVYVHFSSVENCPLVILEAARAGLPFAAIPVGGIPELQEALECRYELDPARRLASVEVLRPLLESAEMRKAVGRRVRSRYEEAFDPAAMVDAYLKVIAGMRRS